MSQINEPKAVTVPKETGWVDSFILQNEGGEEIMYQGLMYDIEFDPNCRVKNLRVKIRALRKVTMFTPLRLFRRRLPPTTSWVVHENFLSRAVYLGSLTRKNQILCLDAIGDIRERALNDGYVFSENFIREVLRPVEQRLNELIKALEKEVYA